MGFYKGVHGDRLEKPCLRVICVNKLDAMAKVLQLVDSRQVLLGV